MSKPGKELYVGSLSYDVTEYELEKLFAVSGNVTSIHLITDAVTGQFKGCGYVRMSTEAEARDAIDSLDGA
jgi:RNA recognition motif-containing protein